MTKETKQPTQLDDKEDQDGIRLVSDSGDASFIAMKTSDKPLGSSYPKFTTGLIRQLVNIASHGSEVDENGTAFALSVVKGVKPRDELEGMLAAQMVAIHNATMTFSRRLAHVENIPQQDSAERALNKLARTYALQLQALQKYRSGGKQSMVVKHVHVNEGGQAIVGNVEAGGSVK